MKLLQRRHATLARATVLLSFLLVAAETLPAAGKKGGKNQSAATAPVKKFLFKKTPQGELAIHIHFPPGWQKTDKRPAIVFFFGGGWRAGTVKQFEPQAAYLASRGMVAARADYRVKSRHNTGPDKCVEDCKSAVRWLRQNAERLGIDPQRIVASGGSAGGHTAACTAILKGFEADSDDTAVSSKPNLLVLFNPALNTANVRREYISAELAKKISPVHHLTKDVPPTIIFFGTNDRLLTGAKEYIRAAGKLGFEAELWIAPGQKHGFFNRSPWRERTLYLTDLFLTKHGFLKGKPTVQPPANAEMKRVSAGKQ